MEISLVLTLLNLILGSLLCLYDSTEAKEKWNYVTVRKDAHMFWWLYYTTADNDYTQKPLIMWLQGGPGGSSTGFGNFEELGPLDVNLKPRESTWLSAGSLLFVDNPVGSGYSYVTSDSAYTTDVSQIAKDLLIVMKSFLDQAPEFQAVPFYIFSESYGGKMNAAFSQLLYKSVQDGKLKCNFQGFAMGDSWISGIDSVLSWAPYLLTTSLVDKAGFLRITNSSQETEAALKAGLFEKATELWDQTENVVGEVTYGVNWYNILKWGSAEDRKNKDRTLYSRTNSLERRHIDKLYQRHVKPMQEAKLDALMNGPIRKKLGIIPQNVTWGAQSGKVFSKQSVDFMKPVIKIVDDMLMNSNLRVVVYNGQLDLICDTLGTEAWVDKLNWSGLSHYKKAPRKPMEGRDQTVLGYEKKYKNFSFYWILDAGHMIPADAGEAALLMVNKILNR